MISCTSPTSLDIHATVTHEDTAGREAALIRGKEKNHSRDFLCPAVTTERNRVVEEFRAILSHDLSQAFFDL